jgi:hypothetical protein
MTGVYVHVLLDFAFVSYRVLQNVVFDRPSEKGQLRYGRFESMIVVLQENAIVSAKRIEQPFRVGLQHIFVALMNIERIALDVVNYVFRFRIVRNQPIDQTERNVVRVRVSVYD